MGQRRGTASCVSRAIRADGLTLYAQDAQPYFSIAFLGLLQRLLTNVQFNGIMLHCMHYLYTQQAACYVVRISSVRHVKNLANDDALKFAQSAP